jgi:dGTP triphosphohydrolase
MATREHAKIAGVISHLFDHLCAHPEEIPESIPDGEPATRVTDHLAGMTDRYCIRAFEQLCVPVSFAP